MKLLVFGSTGSIGRQIVAQALDRGHTVTAFARTPSKLDIKNENLENIQGNVLDAQSIERALQGHQAVLVALGAPGRNKDKIRSRGTNNIIQAMKQKDVSRIICLSTLGVGESWQQIPLLYKFLFSTFFLKPAFNDHERQEEYLRQSGLEWVIVRPGAFTDGELTGNYHHGFAPSDKTIEGKISRADVADFMLSQLTDDTYLRQAPGVSY